jgi:hypothetical protein
MKTISWRVDMKKIGFVFAFIMLLSQTGFAQEKASPALLAELNRGVEFFTKTKVQYQTHQQAFKLEMPYIEVITGKAQQVKMLKKLVQQLGGKLNDIDEKKIIVSNVMSVDEALLLDASEEIGAIAYCNLMKYKFNDPEVNKVVDRIKDESLYFYLLFDNISQLAIMTKVHTQGKFGPSTKQQVPEYDEPPARLYDAD